MEVVHFKVSEFSLDNFLYGFFVIVYNSNNVMLYKIGRNDNL